MLFSRYDRYVERHARSFIERLQSLCRMPSVAARGTGMRAMAEEIEQSLKRVGAGTRTFKFGSGHPIVYGECGAAQKSFIVYGHYDVAPIGNVTEWSFGPFSATVADDKLYSRGVANGKGDIVARLAAVEAYQKSFGKLPVTLKFLLEGEDNLGSHSLYRFSKENCEMLQANGCVWDEGYKDTKDNLVISLGFKGISFIELRVQGARTELHSKWGGVVSNPAWRVVQALSTITSPKGVITIDGFTSYIAPPTEEDLEALKHIHLDEGALKKDFRITGFMRGMKGQTLVKELVFGPTCTICGVHTGYTEAGAKTVLPAYAMARLDFRLVPDLTPQLVVKLLRDHLDLRGFQDVEIVELAASPTAKSSHNSRVARAAIDSAKEIYGAHPIVYPLDPASGPVGGVCGIAESQTPVVSVGTSYSASNPHGPDEHIRLDDFIQHIKFLGRLIHNLGKQKRGQETESLALEVAARK
jgi:acetylornithine deacetylase/succinyl-diaminopimelate desuccinylase-like protein